MIYQTLNHRICEQALSVTTADGTPLDIRPKTCQLLLLLIKSSGQPVSKKSLLETVWKDSVVSEQVVFQSINEIRQLFPNDDVIKTIPKQGYLWLPKVEPLESVTVEIANNSTRKNNTKRTQTQVNRLAVLCCSLVAVILLLFAFKKYDISTGSQNAQQQVKGSIIILPTQNHIIGNDHNWVKLGMMDQVIQRLPNSKHNAVLATDYVLQVLNRANAPQDNIQVQDIQKIFQVSGAELVVLSKLLGSPHDYQLVYTLHYRDYVKKGVITNGNIQSLIDDFSQLIAKQIGGNSQLVHQMYETDFNNQMLGMAIETSNEGNYQLAKSMLETIVLSNPDNYTAQRILIEIWLRLKQFEQAKIHIKNVLPALLNSKNEGEITRLLHLKALSFYVTYDDKTASKVAEQALKSAKKNNDWLLMAQIKNLQAAIALNTQDYVLVEKLYKEEKEHHQVLRCPVGEAHSWANLAKLAKIQKQPEKFHYSIDKAISIAKHRDLDLQLAFFIETKQMSFN
ncbi:hypothetical protein GCM10009128_07340 [Psychrosphaera haliotis]